MTMLGAGGSVENSVGEAAVSGILCQREAEPVCCGAVEAPSRSNPARPLRLQIKQFWCESEIRI